MSDLGEKPDSPEKLDKSPFCQLPESKENLSSTENVSILVSKTSCSETSNVPSMPETENMEDLSTKANILCSKQTSEIDGDSLLSNKIDDAQSDQLSSIPIEKPVSTPDDSCALNSDIKNNVKNVDERPGTPHSDVSSVPSSLEDALLDLEAINKDLELDDNNGFVNDKERESLSLAKATNNAIDEDNNLSNDKVSINSNEQDKSSLTERIVIESDKDDVDKQNISTEGNSFTDNRSSDQKEFSNVGGDKQILSDHNQENLSGNYKPSLDGKNESLVLAKEGNDNLSNTQLYSADDGDTSTSQESCPPADAKDNEESKKVGKAIKKKESQKEMEFLKEEIDDVQNVTSDEEKITEVSKKKKKIIKGDMNPLKKKKFKDNSEENKIGKATKMKNKVTPLENENCNSNKTKRKESSLLTDQSNEKPLRKIRREDSDTSLQPKKKMKTVNFSHKPLNTNESNKVYSIKNKLKANVTSRSPSNISKSALYSSVNKNKERKLLSPIISKNVASKKTHNRKKSLQSKFSKFSSSSTDESSEEEDERYTVKNTLKNKSNIAQTLKKRSLNEGERKIEVPAKLPKLTKGKPLKENIPADANEYLLNTLTKEQKKLKRVKRNDLESIILQLFIDKVLYEHELGHRRDLCKRLESTLDANKKKVAQFYKELEDMKKVMQRLQQEHLVRKSQCVIPVKVKRSVGIQASPTFIMKGLMHTSSSDNSNKTISPTNMPSSTPGEVNTVQDIDDSVIPIQVTPKNPLELDDSPILPTERMSIGMGVKHFPSPPIHYSGTTKTELSDTLTSTTQYSPTSHQIQMQNENVYDNSPITNLQAANISSNSPSFPQIDISNDSMPRTGAMSLSAQETNTGSQLSLGGSLDRPMPTLQASQITKIDILPAPNIPNQVPYTTFDGSTQEVQNVPIVALDNNPNIPCTDATTDRLQTFQHELSALDRPLQSLSQNASVPAIYTTSAGLSHASSIQNPQQAMVMTPSNMQNASRTYVIGTLAGNSNTARNSSPVIGSLQPVSCNENLSAISLTSNITQHSQFQQLSSSTGHPAPLPFCPPPPMLGGKKPPPLPKLKLSHKNAGIVLSWNMLLKEDNEEISNYQLFAYQEGRAPPTSSLWKKVGCVKALQLPMACTLTQFMPGHVYHFTLRAMDIKNRFGPFAEPRSITL